MADSRPKKTKPSDLKPGEFTAWKNGRRYYKAQDGTVTVEPRVWSSLLNNWTYGPSFELDSEARDWQASQRVARANGQEIDPKLGRQSFAAIAAEWLMSNPSKSPGACETDKERLKGTGVVLVIEGEGKQRKVRIEGKPERFAARSIKGGITTADVKELINTWKVDYQPNTIRGMYSAVRAVLSYAEEHEYIPRSPCWKIKPTRDLPKLPKVSRPVHRRDATDDDDFMAVFFLDNDDLIRLAEALGPDYALMVWLGVCFGLRWEEAAGLSVGSLQELFRFAKVDIKQVLDRKTGQLIPKTKTDAGRRYLIDKDLAVDIHAQMAHRHISLSDHEDTLLFVNARTGEPLTYDSWRNTWAKALRQAGLDRPKPDGKSLGMHDLRSMNRSIMNEVGVDQTTARFRFGHSDGDDPQDRMDDVYSRTSPRQNREASEKIHAVVRRVPLEKTGGQPVDETSSSDFTGLQSL